MVQSIYVWHKLKGYLFSRDYTENGRDPALVQAFLSAMQAFSRNEIDRGELRYIDQDKSVWAVVSVGPINVAAELAVPKVAESGRESLKNALREFLTDIAVKFQDLYEPFMESYSGNSRVFDGFSRQFLDERIGQFLRNAGRHGVRLPPDIKLNWDSYPKDLTNLKVEDPVKITFEINNYSNEDVTLVSLSNAVPGGTECFSLQYLSAFTEVSGSIMLQNTALDPEGLVKVYMTLEARSPDDLTYVPYLVYRYREGRLGRAFPTTRGIQRIIIR